MTKPKPLPPIDYLRKRLRYEPETGKLFWLDYEGMHQRWRTRYAGTEAFTSVDNKRYARGCVDGCFYSAHRIAWTLYYGEWPANQIDHINGVRTDNRVENLRVVTNQENQRNKAIPKSNTSGVMGVSWCKRDKKWRAEIRIDGRSKHLGYFNTLEEAAEVRKAASEKYGFTERHGLPTNVGEACD